MGSSCLASSISTIIWPRSEPVAVRSDTHCGAEDSHGLWEPEETLNIRVITCGLLENECWHSNSTAKQTHASHRVSAEAPQPKFLDVHCRGNDTNKSARYGRMQSRSITWQGYISSIHGHMEGRVQSGIQCVCFVFHFEDAKSVRDSYTYSRLHILSLTADVLPAQDS